MITLLGVMDVNAMSERRNDLVVSAEDLKIMARNERIQGYGWCYDIVREYMQRNEYDYELFSKIEKTFEQIREM